MGEGAQTYELVLRAIEDDLRAGRLRVGDRLPAERQLAEAHGVSRASIREAMRVLDAIGVVRIRSGAGPNSGAVIAADAGAALGWALRMHVATRALPVRDIVETRILLERRIAAEALGEVDAAALAATLAAAGELLDRMDDPALPAERFHELDAELHIALAGLSPNVVLATMLESLRHATVGYVREASARMADWPAVRDELQRQHRGIVAAFEARDAADAGERLAAHIRWFFETALRAGAIDDPEVSLRE